VNGKRPDTHPYRRIARSENPEYTESGSVRPVRIAGVEIGSGEIAVIAGPCAVEGLEQMMEIARAAKRAGAHLLRGGAFKPRTSPYDFQGLGREGLEILAEARRVTGLGVVTEVLDTRDVDLVAELADCIQIGARSMQNFPLLREVGRSGRPVLLKRHWAATLDEWLCAAEYIANEGNLDILLCERGIRTFTQGDYNRNTLDLNVVPALRERTFLPVVVDPSHSTGHAAAVVPAALASIGVGVDALLVEITTETAPREQIRSDAEQAIRPEALARIVQAAAGPSRRHLTLAGGCG
jgi:3-deoxy-7-phosphoheptulonate synthase